MGIFSKKPAKKLLNLKAEKKGKLTAITGELPDGFDPHDPAQVRKLIYDTLKESGELPEGMDLENLAKVDLTPTPAEDGLKGEVTLTRKIKSAAEGLKKMEGHKVPPLDLPQDQAKASFITCLNRLHEYSHQMGPMVADLYNSLDCLRMSLDASKPGPKEKARFEGFVEGVEEMLRGMCGFGSDVCEFTKKVAERGIPAPDAQSTTVN